MLTSKGYHIVVNNTKSPKVIYIEGRKMKAATMLDAFAEYDRQLAYERFYQEFMQEAEPTSFDL